VEIPLKDVIFEDELLEELIFQVIPICDLLIKENASNE